MSTNQLKNQHLLWRAGFGPSINHLDSLATISPAELFQQLKKSSEKTPAYIDVADNWLKGLVMGADDLKKRKQLDEADRRMVRERNRDGIKSLNTTWLFQMIESEAQLREKMAFFWHGHFASRNINILYQQQMLDVIRTNALGSFRDLLHGVSKSAGMLIFLNAQQNKKDHPNENFAREVMELFTLGRGNYTEQDIKEAARAFTGWSANLRGDFVFRPFQHDNGTKKVFGRSGNFKGEEILDILLEQKQTAKFITEKIYRFYVNEKPDAAKVEWLAARFYKSDYNISGLLQDIFTSDWFYNEKHIGTKIKSPIELIAGIQRMLPMKLENEDALLVLQRLLGQVLFYPPNVAGWPGGKSWIDSSTLMVRMRIPLMIVDADPLNMKPKTDDDVQGGQMEGSMMKAEPVVPSYGKAARPLMANINWKKYIDKYAAVSREQLTRHLANTLLQVPSKVSPDVLRNAADSSTRESFIKTTTLQVMSLPEYQMC